MPSIDLISLLNLPLSKLLRVATLAEISTNVRFLKGEGAPKEGNTNMRENMSPDETANALADEIRKQREGT